MSYAVFIEARADKALGKLRREAQERLDPAMDALAEDPGHLGSRKLSGREGSAYRSVTTSHRMTQEPQRTCRSMRIITSTEPGNDEGGGLRGHIWTGLASGGTFDPEVKTMSRMLELPDPVYTALHEAAAARGLTPAAWIAPTCPRPLRPRGRAEPPRSLVDLFVGRVGQVGSGGRECLSEGTGEKFAELRRKSSE